MKTSFAALAAACLLMGGAPQATQQPQPAAPAGGEPAINVIQVRPEVYMLAGGGGNVVVHIGEDGIFQVDTGSAASAEAIIAAIKGLTREPIRYIINTSADADHVGGNETIARALGRTIFNAGNALGAAMTNNGAASILANERVLFRMSAPTGQVSPYPASAWPTETFETGRKYMRMNRDAIEIVHQPAAHTDGDTIVVFRRADVIVAGDVMDTRRFPVIDRQRGGSVNGVIAALNFLVNTAIPNFPLTWREEITYVVPGHGRLSDQTDVAEYRDMVTIIRDRIADGIKSGLTLAQIKAASPTQGYTQRYGGNSGPWTTEMFVDAVYLSLTEK